MLKLYYETDAIRVSYDEDLQLAVGEWKGFITSKELRKAALDSLAFVNKHNVTRWMADRRKMKAIRQKDQEWTVETFVPLVMQSPVRRIANVLSEDMFNKMAIESIYQRSGGLGDIAFRDFETIEDAMDWLKQPFKQIEPIINRTE